MTPSHVSSGRSAGVWSYLKAAFTYHWNLLFFAGGAGLAALSGRPDALLPVVAAVEIAYLAGMLAIPRFRTAVDARAAKDARLKNADPSAQHSLQKMLDSLPAPALQRFGDLRMRCYEMRDIASGVRGQAAGAESADSIRTPALDRLLFLFLKLLMSQDGLRRFLRSTSEPQLQSRVDELKGKIAAASASGSDDDRMKRSLQDSLVDAELRLENYRKSMKDAEFVAIELDRIETKIQALTEMGVSRQDPDALSHQVTAAAESMHQTEDAVKQLQHLTGLADQLAEPPAILDADIGSVVQRGR
jgi:hypothetical protein